MATNVTLMPGPVLNDDNTYVLQSKDIQALLKYVWTGVLIAVDKTTYKQRIGILGDIKPSLVALVDGLLVNYRSISVHSKNFKDVTYPMVVGLASEIYSYAQNAGGTLDDSYYALMIKAGKDWYTESKKTGTAKNQAKIDEYKEVVQGLVDVQVQSIELLRVKAAAATKGLRDFEAECKSDQINLESTRKQLKDKLTGSSGDIAKMEVILEAKRKELIDDQAEYEHDVIVASTAASYAAVWPIGTIAAAIVIGIYTDKAIKMKATIDAIKTLMSEGSAQLVADKALVADLGCIGNDLDTVIALIGPAVTAIEKMVGIWDSIANDLQAVRTLVSTQAPNSSSPASNPILQKISQDAVLKKWNALRDAVDKYRKMAYIATPTVTTLDQMSKDLGKATKAA